MRCMVPFLGGTGDRLTTLEVNADRLLQPTAAGLRDVLCGNSKSGRMIASSCATRALLWLPTYGTLSELSQLRASPASAALD